MLKNIGTACLVALTLWGLTRPARADDCKLGRIASIDFTESEDGSILFPVSIQGTQKMVMLDTGAEVSAVDPQVAADLHLTIHRIAEGYAFNGAGEPFTQMAVVHGLDIGQMHAEEVRLLVWPSRLSSDGNLAGTFGADFLHHYDIDIDFGSHKLGFFSQDHCPGKVVYWPATSVATIPIRVVKSGHIVMPVTLDSHSFDAMLDTGAPSHLSEGAAKSAFGLTADSPDMTRVNNFDLKTPVYRHAFKAMQLEGLTIANPTVYIWDDQTKDSMTQTPQLGSRISDADEQSGVTDMVVGVGELHHLHVYIAYKEQKLYVTAASPPPDAHEEAPATKGIQANSANR
ncbi:MAG TPA: retropepsin-like aspartic protease [Rhizomicrobium sp.]